MKIAIEAQRIFRRKKHGMDFVVLEMVRQLQRIDRDNEYFIMVSPGEDRCLEGSDNVHIVEVRSSNFAFWEQLALPEALRKIKPDLLHCTSNTAPMNPPVPLVLTLHDVMFMEPWTGTNKSWYQRLGRYYRKFVVPRIVPRCRKIVTVSDFAREHIAGELNLPDGAIVTVHNGYSSHFKLLENVGEVTRKYIPREEGYIFFLGNTEPRKNSVRTLKAFARYAEGSADPRPLLIGDLSESIVDEILRQEGIEKVKPLIFTPGYIPNTDLPYIYNGAFAFMFCSLRESFGIPILEAMACGTPVITSTLEAMPEIAGEGALLVDPTDVEAMASMLLELETSEEFYRQNVEYGLKRVKAFSWEKTARRMLDVYRSVYKDLEKSK